MSTNRLRTPALAWIIGGVLSIGHVPVSRVSAQAEPGGFSGSATFTLYCSSCHGTSAKGDGPLASVLKTPPPDLTEIARRNGGSFPAAQVARTIDGRSPVKGHGGADMPVWGDAFAKSAADPTPVDEKIQRLVTFLASIQVKP